MLVVSIENLLPKPLHCFHDALEDGLIGGDEVDLAGVPAEEEQENENHEHDHRYDVNHGACATFFDRGDDSENEVGSGRLARQRQDRVVGQVSEIASSAPFGDRLDEARESDL